MNFKEYVANDIVNTFVNNDEFAVDAKINGVVVNVIEDSNQLEYRIKENYGGLIIGDVLFFISEEEYAKIPRVTNPPNTNQAINYNGKPATIVDVGRYDGMYEIILQNAGGH